MPLQLVQYYEWDEGVLPPLNMKMSLRSTKNGGVHVQEPIAELLGCTEDCLSVLEELKSRPSASVSPGGSSSSTAMDVDLPIVDIQSLGSHAEKLRAMLNSILRRTIKSELEDWELDSTTDFEDESNQLLVGLFTRCCVV